MGVLAKGLNFSIAPERVPIKEIITVTEVVCQQLKLENGQPDQQAANDFRNKVVGIFQNTKPPNSNINKAVKTGPQSPE